MNAFLRNVEDRLVRERVPRVEAFEDPTHYVRGTGRDVGPDAAMTLAERRAQYVTRGRRVAYQMRDGTTLEDAAQALGITPRQAQFALRAAKAAKR